jgi:uncharacterized protein (DUF433 family)
MMQQPTRRADRASGAAKAGEYFAWRRELTGRLFSVPVRFSRIGLGRPPAIRYTGAESKSILGGKRMAEVVKTEHPHIVRLEGVCGGEPVIDGLRVTVRHVVTLHRRGETILEIAEALGISEAQVFHALSYFFDHREEILALIAQEEQAHARYSRP